MPFISENKEPVNTLNYVRHRKTLHGIAALDAHAILNKILFLYNYSRNGWFPMALSALI